ncbi:acyl-CoA N-acyltransferase [Mrakia frigida]|uniref:peptide alpha-N-acetyltransferase MAK3 n=1 Tax=Mrakia frigida TaxID=29902 RepID=UPI003FCBF58A
MEPSSSTSLPVPVEILYRPYTNEDDDLPHIQRLVESELSEPYTIYTYRYFLHQWPHLAFLAYPSNGSPNEPIALIVCKQDLHRYKTNRGYIAMLSVSREWRKRRIASKLVDLALEAMKNDGAEQIVLETESDNDAALALYESLGFIREKRLYRFYLNGKDAYRLLLPLPPLSTNRSLPPAPAPAQPSTPLLVNNPNQTESNQDAVEAPKLPPRVPPRPDAEEVRGEEGVDGVEEEVRERLRL